MIFWNSSTKLNSDTCLEQVFYFCVFNFPIMRKNWDKLLYSKLIWLWTQHVEGEIGNISTPCFILSCPKLENQLWLVDFSAGPKVWSVATLDSLAPVPEGQGFSVTLWGGSWDGLKTQKQSIEEIIDFFRPGYPVVIFGDGWEELNGVPFLTAQIHTWTLLGIGFLLRLQFCLFHPHTPSWGRHEHLF